MVVSNPLIPFKRTNETSSKEKSHPSTPKIRLSALTSFSSRSQALNQLWDATRRKIIIFYDNFSVISRSVDPLRNYSRNSKNVRVDVVSNAPISSKRTNEASSKEKSHFSTPEIRLSTPTRFSSRSQALNLPWDARRRRKRERRERRIGRDRSIESRELDDPADASTRILPPLNPFLVDFSIGAEARRTQRSV